MAEQPRVPKLQELDERQAYRFLTELLCPKSREEVYEANHPEDYIMEMPQSGEAIRGRENMRRFQEAYPGGAPSPDRGDTFPDVRHPLLRKMTLAGINATRPPLRPTFAREEVAMIETRVGLQAATGRRPSIPPRPRPSRSWLVTPPASPRGPARSTSLPCDVA